jgi:hypothetical protein
MRRRALPALLVVAALLGAAVPLSAAAPDNAARATAIDNALPAALEDVLPAAADNVAERPAADNALGPAGGYGLLESTVAAVSGEVIFMSDVVREACFYTCGAFPGETASSTTLSKARELYIADTLVLQEQKKLGLGDVDNAALREASAEARARMARCGSPCAARIAPREVEEYVARRLLVRDFLVKRISVFIEVTDEEVQREVERRRDRAGKDAAGIREEDVRRTMVEERTAREVRNWFSRAASKARIVLSPLEAK